jgi:hypothetical protein
VVVTRIQSPPLPAGTAVTLCLSTGDGVVVFLTSAGDTLVGPSRTPLSELRPAVALAGVYAETRAWFETGEPITVEQRSYGRLGTPVELDCDAIRQVGEHLGVPLFTTGTGGAVPETLYVPVRPGVWHPYALVPG